LIALNSTAAQAAQPHCAVPDEFTRLDEALPVTAERLKHHQKLTIVAFGSSSTAGVGASSPLTTYPSQMGQRLAHRFPDARISVLNEGIAGESSVEMAARFDRDTIDLHPDLVIWQTGSNDILLGADPAKFEVATREGVRRLHAAGIDVMIMEPQYSPRIVANPNYGAYMTILDKIARDEGVPIVHRFEAMEYWLDSGALTHAEILSGDALHMSDASYACLGDLVAAEISQSVAPPARFAGHTTSAGTVMR
jgi:lysophospholipase L1-like esterase